MLRKAVEESRDERKKVLNLVSKTLQEGLAKAHLPSCTVVGREKPLYSIYQKMRDKHRPLMKLWMCTLFALLSMMLIPVIGYWD